MGTTTRPLAVVTGASSGIGRELARQFAEHGYDLLITSTGPTIAEAARDLEGTGASVTTVQTDLATYEGIESLYRAIQETGRPVDAIALNAGVGVGGDFARETKLEDELNLIALNVTGTVHLAKRVLPDMVARGEGRVLFTSSIAALMPGPFAAIYFASKAFVQSFALALRNELQETGVTITALVPGPTDTNFFQRSGEDQTKMAAEATDSPALIAQRGFDALMAGKAEVIAGSLKTQAIAAMAKVLPSGVMAEGRRRLGESNEASSKDS